MDCRIRLGWVMGGIDEIVSLVDLPLEHPRAISLIVSEAESSAVDLLTLSALTFVNVMLPASDDSVPL